MKKIEMKIKEDILKTLETLEKINTDLFNISEKAYRYHVNKWDNEMINSFDKTSINDIKIFTLNIVKITNVRLQFSGLLQKRELC